MWKLFCEGIAANRRICHPQSTFACGSQVKKLDAGHLGTDRRTDRDLKAALNETVGAFTTGFLPRKQIVILTQKLAICSPVLKP
jgi:hypothetical protein